MGEESSGNSAGHNDGGGVEISIDPGLRGSTVATEDGLKETPFRLDLGHELAHNKDFLTNGEKVLDVWVENTSDPKRPAREREKFATHIENINRSRMAIVKVYRADRTEVRRRGEDKKVTASRDDLCNSGRVSFTRLPQRREAAKDREGCGVVSRIRGPSFARLPAGALPCARQAGLRGPLAG